jgi:pimeloyl-ACP methyl ester carboxylesterase
MRAREVLRMFAAGRSREALERFARYNAGPAHEWDPELLRRLIDRALFVRRNCAPVFSMPRRFRDTELSGVAARTLLLLGEHNRWYDRRKLELRARKAVRDVEVCVLAGAGLDPFLEQPETSAAAVLEFLVRE